MFHTQVSQRVRTDDPVDLLHGMAGGDQQLLVGDIGAEITGMGEGRGRDAVMDLLGAGVPQQADSAGAGGAPHHRVVHQHHPLAGHGGGDGVELDAHAVFPLGLAALDEGAAHILVFDKADAVGNAAFQRIAQRGVQPGIRRADDHIGLHRVFLGQKTAGLQSGFVDAGALNDRVRAGKIDVLEHAQGMGGGVAVGADAAQTEPVGHHDLAGLHIPQHPGAHGVQRAGFRRKGIAGAVGQLADAQRAEPMGVAGGDELGVGHDDQAVGALDLFHRAADSGLDVRGDQPVLGQQIADHLGIGGAVKDRAAHLQLVAQPGRVGQVAVVADGHGALAVVQYHRLGVGPAALAGGGIPHMAGGHLGAFRQVLQHPLGEHLAHQAQVPVAGQHAVHIQGDAAAFLAAVLQRVQGAVHGADHVGLAGGIIDAEDPALLVQTADIQRKIAHGNKTLRSRNQAGAISPADAS